MVHFDANKLSQVVGDVCAGVGLHGSDTGQSWWKPKLEACPSRVGLLVTSGCPCVVEAARLVGPAMQGVIAGFTASRSNRALLAVFVLCSLYALYLLGDSLTPKNMCVPPWLPGRALLVSRVVLRCCLCWVLCGAHAVHAARLMGGVCSLQRV